jgi:hypothetical protein
MQSKTKLGGEDLLAHQGQLQSTRHLHHQCRRKEMREGNSDLQTMEIRTGNTHHPEERST